MALEHRGGGIYQTAEQYTDTPTGSMNELHTTSEQFHLTPVQNANSKGANIHLTSINK